MTTAVLRPVRQFVGWGALMACLVAGMPVADVDARSPQEGAMEEAPYTLGVWRVKAGHEAEFIDAWKALGEIFSALPHPPGQGTLIQSVVDPLLFYSFGPWTRLEDIEAMRRDPDAQAGIRRLAALCTEATPGAFRVVAEVPPAVR